MRKRIYTVIEIGNRDDVPSRLFDYFIVVCILSNLIVMLLSTFDELSHLSDIFMAIDRITGIVFLIEYVLRVTTADFKYVAVKQPYAGTLFIFSLTGLIDGLTVLTIFTNGIVPGGIVAFRLLRVVRTFRLLQVTPNSDAIAVVISVIKQRSSQLLASIFFFGVLDIFASLMMYYIEHDAQPDVFVNAFSGIWWSISTLLTVGYGDIYPVTTYGKVVAIFVALLGVCAVAVPTGIISAGFVEQFKEERRKDNVDKRLVDRVRKQISKSESFTRLLINLLDEFERRN